MRGRDLNPRPLGYEPNELPGCSTPRQVAVQRTRTASAEEELYQPPTRRSRNLAPTVKPRKPLTSRAHPLRTARAMDVLRHDIRQAVRGLARSKATSFAAFLTLALGLGVTTALISVVDGVLLRPLPYPESEQLVRVSEQHGTAVSPHVRRAGVDARGNRPLRRAVLQRDAAPARARHPGRARREPARSAARWSCGRASSRRAPGLALGSASPSARPADALAALRHRAAGRTVVRGQLGDAGRWSRWWPVSSRRAVPRPAIRASRCTSRSRTPPRDPPVATRRRLGLTRSDSGPAAGSAWRTARRRGPRRMRTPRRRTSGRRAR